MLIQEFIFNKLVRDLRRLPLLTCNNWECWGKFVSHSKNGVEAIVTFRFMLFQHSVRYPIVGLAFRSTGSNPGGLVALIIYFYGFSCMLQCSVSKVCEKAVFFFFFFLHKQGALKRNMQPYFHIWVVLSFSEQVCKPTSPFSAAPFISVMSCNPPHLNSVIVNWIELFKLQHKEGGWGHLQVKFTRTQLVLWKKKYDVADYNKTHKHFQSTRLWRRGRCKLCSANVLPPNCKLSVLAVCACWETDWAGAEFRGITGWYYYICLHCHRWVISRRLGEGRGWDHVEQSCGRKRYDQPVCHSAPLKTDFPFPWLKLNDALGMS